MMTRRVLFVDDEPNVLDGLRRMLRPLRGEWEMQFASGGQEALTMIAGEAVDVLVTDMRMPGMDGVELLEIVRQQHPRTVRIVLTGQCTREAMLRLVRLAHRVLTKPCDPEALKTAVRRACALQALLHNPPLVALVGQLGSLPTPPDLYTRLVAELEKPDGSIVEVGNLIAQDIGLSAKLLQMANSSLLGLRTRTTSPVQAVQILGTETTKALVLVAEVLTRYDASALRPHSIDDLWDHSRSVAELAGAIARTEVDRVMAAESRLIGLLHDIGRLIFASQLPERYRDAIRLARDDRIPLVDAEHQVFGASHTEVGAYLLALWGLPELLVEAVAWHHTPGRCHAPSFGPLTAVHVAEAIVGVDESATVDELYLKTLGLDNRLPVWLKLRDEAGGTRSNT